MRDNVTVRFLLYLALSLSPYRCLFVDIWFRRWRIGGWIQMERTSSSSRSGA